MAIILPIEGLEVGQLITAAFGDRSDVVNFPAVVACLPVFLAANHSAAGIGPVVGITRDRFRLLPDGFDGGRVK